jgi:hypothetical protein
MPTDAHRSLLDLAARQHGAFSRPQALGAGLRPHQLRYLLEVGRVSRIARGVYAVTGSPITWEQRAMASLLLRPDATLAFQAAGHVHGLLAAPLHEPPLIVPPGTSARGALGRLHRLDLPLAHRAVVDGLRTTTAARTLVDLSDVLGTRQVTKLIDQAISSSGISPNVLRSICEDANHVRRSGRDAVLAALAAWEGIRPGSPAEARLVRFLREWGLPEPDRQVPIRDEAGEVIGRVDLGWPRVRFGVEYDGLHWHGPARWLEDEARHGAICRSGWTLLHVGTRDLLPSSDLRVRIGRHLALEPTLRST